MNIQPGFLTLAQLRQIHTGSEPLTIDPSATAGIRASARLVQQAAQGGAAVYGVNTGFGKLANQRIAQTDLNTLQLNLLRSHAVGVGEPMPEQVVRLVLLLKAASLARGFSGVRACVIDLLLALYIAARRLQPMLRNTEYIVAIELLTAAQGIAFLRPLKSAAALEGVLQLVRSVSPAMMHNRNLAPDIGAVRQLVAQGRIGLAGEAQITELTALRLV